MKIRLRSHLAAVWRRHRRALIATVAVMVLLAGVVVVGLQQAYPATKVQLRPGTAWVTSNRVGQVALLDGASDSLADELTVATDGHDLAAGQLGSAGYVADQSTGEVRRIDGASLTASQPARLTAATSGTFAIYPTTTDLYVVDRDRGEVDSADPATLGALHNPVQVGPGSQFQADDSTLWILDSRTGDLTGLTNGDEHGRGHVVDPKGAQLALAAGRPAVVDATAGRAYLLDPDSGAVTENMPLALTDSSVVGGSSGRLRVLVTDSGDPQLRSCSFTAGGCAAPIRFATSSAQLGAPVEVGDTAFVPDYSDGSVWLADLPDNNRGPHVQIFRRSVRFQLFARDGLVFYNDPDSAQAGVIDLHGDAFGITKYTIGPPQVNPSATSTPKPNPSITPTTRPKPGPTTRTTQPTVPLPVITTPKPPAPLVVRAINIAPPVIETGDKVAFTATVNGGPPTSYQWSITNLGTSTVEATGTDLELDHTFTAAGTYRVDLTVADAVSTAMGSKMFTVTAAPPALVCGATITTDVRLTADLTCPSDGVVIGAAGLTVDLNGHTLTGPGTGSSTAGILGFSSSNGTIFNNLTVMNGTVSNFGTGIDICSGGIKNTVLTGDNASINEPPPCAQDVSVTGGAVGSFDLSLDGNTTIANSSVQGDITAVKSGLTIDASDMKNVDITSSESGVVIENNPNAVNFHLSAITSGVTVKDNTLTGNGGIAVQLNDVSPNAQITGNTVSGYQIGVELDGSSSLDDVAGAVISGNTFSNNSGAGVYIDSASGSASKPLIVSGNTFSGNGCDCGGPPADTHGQAIDGGIHLDLPANPNLTVSSNTITRSGDFAIDAANGVSDGGSANHASNNHRLVGAGMAQCRGITCVTP
jgi:parallel beta-helix repeat protein